MATSFNGWLDSWRGWGASEANPNDMQGEATISFSAAGTISATGAAQRVGGGRRKRGRFEVDSFSDFAPKPVRRNDDEDCLMLMMI